MLVFPDHALAPQRVFCIGCNYGEHIREMGGSFSEDDQCVVFMKPATSLVAPDATVRLPRDRGAVHHEVELALAIGSGGRDIPEADALGHVAGATLGIDLTLRDVQARLKEKGQPWELCKAFDQSALLGAFVPADAAGPLDAVELICTVDGEERQRGHTGEMLFGVARIVSILSRTWALVPGDVVYTGTPPGVGPVNPGETLVAESPQLGRWSWTFA